MPLAVHNQTETPHWSTPLNLHRPVRKDLPGGVHDSGFTSFGRSLLPWLGVNTSKAMIRNLSLTLENTTESTAKAIAAQQKSLHSLIKIALDKKITLDYLLAEQGVVCAVASTICCTWISTAAVETQLYKITEYATGLRK